MARPKLTLDGFEEYVVANSVFGMIDAARLNEKYPVSSATIYRRLKSMGILHAQDYLLSIVKAYLSGETVRSLADQYGISQVTINAFFRRHDIPQRNATYLYNRSYFESIDSEDKAYFLGFILADGCVHGNTLNISLSSKDVDILEKFRVKLKGNFKIHTSVQTTTYGIGEVVRIQLSSASMISDLANLGVSERKTETASFPEIREDLKRHMLRGYLDGDGSFTKYLNRGIHIKYTVGFCGSPEALEYIRNYLYDVHPSRGSILKRHKESTSRVLHLAYSGGLTVKAYLDHFYKDSEVYLERKFRKYQNFYVT